MNQKMKKEKKWKVVIVTMLALVMLCLCFGVTVLAKSRLESEEKQKFYLRQKEQVVRNVRAYLSDKGYQNSGVTLTRRDYGDGTEEYQLAIHHGKLEKLDAESWGELVNDLAVFAESFGADAKMQVVLH